MNILFPDKLEFSYFPVAFISYQRNYFFLKHLNLRITIDSGIKFFTAKKGLNKIAIGWPRFNNFGIMELKYDEKVNLDYKFIEFISNKFDLIQERSSKYCEAIKSLYNN